MVSNEIIETAKIKILMTTNIVVYNDKKYEFCCCCCCCFYVQFSFPPPFCSPLMTLGHHQLLAGHNNTGALGEGTGGVRRYNGAAAAGFDDDSKQRPSAPPMR